MDEWMDICPECNRQVKHSEMSLTFHDVGECDRYYMDLCRNHGRIEGLEGQYHAASKED